MVGREVLVVDDDPLILEFLCAAFEEEGYRVRRAGDGAEALAEVERAAPDLVVADIVMPYLDGVQLARLLLARATPVPVVLISAARTPPPGAGLPFVPKPFDIEGLLATAAAAIALAAPPTPPRCVAEANVEGLAMPG